MIQWIKKYLPTHQDIEKNSTLKNIKSLRNRELWSFSCEPVARGVAIGLFAAVIPFAQMLIAAILSIIFRANVPVAVAMTWVSNPLTFIPFTYSSFYIGRFILSENGSEIHFKEFCWDSSNLSELWSSFSTWLFQFGKAFFVGMPILAIILAIIGYLGTRLIWRGVLFLRKR